MAATSKNKAIATARVIAIITSPFVIYSPFRSSCKQRIASDAGVVGRNSKAIRGLLDCFIVGCVVVAYDTASFADVSLVLILLKIWLMLTPILDRTKSAAAPIKTKSNEYSQDCYSLKRAGQIRFRLPLTVLFP